MNKTLFKTISFIILMALTCTAACVFAQGTSLDNGNQYKAFQKTLNKVGISFIFPEGFKEIKAVNTRNLKFNYAMELPGKDFEIWFRVNSVKDNKQLLNENRLRVNPDSAYAYIIKQQAGVFTNDNEWLTRQIPETLLNRYNANVGKTYLVNLSDSPVTKHYKYALLITMAKFNAGSILAVCLSNDRGPEFFKNMFEASDCMKFKAQEKAEK
ncbi:hypothetical protein CLV57_0998 [Mucilaginibacter auburnensis]|uniref:Uncharacterized protein n=2 Tax=Mucilaginibacter auburnensis TaxID=1457233 RepID=A0A2H9VT55_9SPHI|nr:hypothetical protein CLV57_0998 [Mucilaginibacter auburnensis]